MADPQIGETLISENGPRYMVIGVLGSAFLGDGFYLTRIPYGMTPQDLGRRFKAKSTADDPAGFELL